LRSLGQDFDHAQGSACATLGLNLVKRSRSAACWRQTCTEPFSIYALGQQSLSL